MAPQTPSPNQDAVLLRRPELFFGLIAAAGTDSKKVQNNLEEKLRSIGYTPITIRLSEIIPEVWKIVDPDALPIDMSHEDKRIESLMLGGDKIREKLLREDAISLLAVSKIRAFRVNRGADEDQPLWNHAFIFNSLKHPKEINTLREIYRDSFFAISIYSSHENRKKHLKRIIAKSYHSMDENSYTYQACKIIETDQKRHGNDFGQNVRDTFPLGDVFINVDKNQAQISRFVDLIFGSPFLTPTIDEHGMFHARAAALRSADLSRQVGALISTSMGEFIAAGCNEVPAPGGGSYWAGQPKSFDDRDYVHGRDANAVMKYDILTEVFDILKDNNWLIDSCMCEEPRSLAEAVLDGKKGISFKNARVASLIEFGRIVHAEMSAITDAARRGIPVLNATLYCTTFPCHMCARHIISAGISRVVYIEPYPKSMTKDLYKKSITVEGNTDSPGQSVKFEPFIGISPEIYMKFFSKPQRKDDKGYAVSWNAEQSSPRYVSMKSFHIVLEKILVVPVMEKIQNNGDKERDNEKQ